MSALDLPQFWWRVEVDTKGGVISCVQVDEERKGTSRVRYVRARSKSQATADAREWHERHKRYQSISAKRLAKRRRDAGQCRKCPEPICEESGYLCKMHLDMHREAKRRHWRGESTPRVAADPVKLKEEHLASHRRHARLGERLPEILAKYRELDGEASPFLFWLEREIEVREVQPMRLVRTG
jgi:hypothetical protein